MNEQSCIETTIENIYFLKELYKIMDEFNIHRVYRISLKNGKIEEAHQLLKTNIGKTKLEYKFFKFLDKNLPIIYFKVFYGNHLKKYKRKLKKLFIKYDIETISTSAFSLYQGIYIANNRICINGIDIKIKCQKVYHIDKLYLEV